MLHLCVRWYERNEDMTPNYEKEHHGTIVGENASDCMMKFNLFNHNHDLSVYTRLEIYFIY